MNKDELLRSGLLEQYVLGLASSEEVKEVERMAAIYPEVNDKICQLQNCMEHYIEEHLSPLSLEEERLSGDSRNKKINKHKYNGAANTHQWRWFLGLAIICVIILSVINLQLYHYQQGLRADIAGIGNRLERMNDNYDQLKIRNERLFQQYALLKDVGTKQIALNGTRFAPAAKLILYWNDEHKKSYLNIIQLPEPPAGHEYQIWANVKGEHKQMCPIDLDKQDSTLHPLPFMSDCKGFVITLEKVGGAVRPNVEKTFAQGEMNL